jgi:hypothetical protein
VQDEFTLMVNLLDGDVLPLVSLKPTKGEANISWMVALFTHVPMNLF